MKFTNPIALTWQKKFIKEFEKYEYYYKHNQNPTRIEARRTGILTRKQQTDIIKQFIAYCVAQGSKNAQKYYANLTKMENKFLFLITQRFPNIREHLNANQLLNIGTADHIVEKALIEGMEQGLDYHDIYKLAKKRIILYADLVGKTNVPQFQIENQSKQLELF